MMEAMSALSSREFRLKLLKRARRVEASLADDQLAALESYFRLLVRWNSRINLTGLKLDPLDERSLDRLLIEPLSAVRFLPPGPVRLMDIGSGSGSPAVPLALGHGRTHLTMVESKTRKAVFLMEVVRELSLPATVETARFEQLLARPDLHEAVDVLSIRAVRVESRTLLGLQAFVKPEGRVFWFRGSGPMRTGDFPPPMRWVATQPLVDSLNSRLVILVKEPVGRASFHVEH